MAEFFNSIWKKLKKTVEEELEDLSYMEIITAVSDDVEKHIDNKGWDILDSLRRGNPPSFYDSARDEENKITKEEMMTSKNTEIIARTRIELDGDVFTVMKGKDATSAVMSKDLMALHNKGIEISVQNWKMFLDFVVDMTSTIGVLVGQVNADNYDKIRRSKK